MDPIELISSVGANRNNVSTSTNLVEDFPRAERFSNYLNDPAPSKETDRRSSDRSAAPKNSDTPRDKSEPKEAKSAPERPRRTEADDDQPKKPRSSDDTKPSENARKTEAHDKAPVKNEAQSEDAKRPGESTDNAASTDSVTEGETPDEPTLVADPIPGLSTESPENLIEFADLVDGAAAGTPGETANSDTAAPVLSGVSVAGDQAISPALDGAASDDGAVAETKQTASVNTPTSPLPDGEPAGGQKPKADVAASLATSGQAAPKNHADINEQAAQNSANSENPTNIPDANADLNAVANVDVEAAAKGEKGATLSPAAGLEIATSVSPEDGASAAALESNVKKLAETSPATGQVSTADVEEQATPLAPQNSGNGTASAEAGRSAQPRQDASLPAGTPSSSVDTTRSQIGGNGSEGAAGNRPDQAAVKAASDSAPDIQPGVRASATNNNTPTANNFAASFGPTSTEGAPSAPQTPAGLQAANAIEQASNLTSQPRPATASTNGLQPSVPLGALAAHITRQAYNGNNRFQIRLDPPELGRVDVRLDVSRDGVVNTHLTVERSETLDLLQRDARALERALTNSGLDTKQGSISFSLQDQNLARHQQNGDGAAEFANNPATDAADDDGLADENAVSSQYYVSASGLDIRV